jgi:Zn ribbon nucleic-acid-binding protein
MHNITFVNKANFVKLYNNFVLKWLIFCAVCGCCTRTDIVREHLEDTLRICDVSAMGLYQQPRRYSFTQSHVIDTRTVELVPPTEHFDHCRTPSGCPQCSSRQRVANICRLERLEASTTNITTFSQGQRDRPFCHKVNQSVKALC